MNPKKRWRQPQSSAIRMPISKPFWKDSRRKRRRLFCKNCRTSGHASPIEHASFTFGIEEAFPALSWRRSRGIALASFSVQSQRYVRLEDFRYVIPPEIEAIPEAKAQFVEAMNADARKYLELVQSLEEAHTRRLMAPGPGRKGRPGQGRQASQRGRPFCAAQCL